MTQPQDVLSFWLDEVKPEQWYVEDTVFDDEVRRRFEAPLEQLCDGRFSLWLTHASGALAYIILSDQLSRNMYRGTARAFATDKIALAAAKAAIDKGWDMKIDVPARQFFYLPLMHSENLVDQDRSVRLICERMGEGNANLLHARAHREVIRQFGRFPYRNTALSRKTTSAEQRYLDGGSYGLTVRELEATAA